MYGTRGKRAIYLCNEVDRVKTRIVCGETIKEKAYSPFRLIRYCFLSVAANSLPPFMAILLDKTVLHGIISAKR